MKKLLLMVFGLSLFMIACTDDEGGNTSGGGTGTEIVVEDFDIKINDANNPSGVSITGFAPNTTMSLKGGVFTIGTTETDILTKDINSSNMASELVMILVHYIFKLEGASMYSESNSDNMYYEFRKQNVSTFNAKVAVSDDEKSATVDLVLLPVRGYAEKVFTVTLTSSAHKFTKPTEVATSSLDFTFRQNDMPNVKFTVGDTDDIGSTTITGGELVASVTPVTVTIAKSLSVTYDEFWKKATAVAEDTERRQVLHIMHSLDGITKDNDTDVIAGEHDMYGVMVYSNIVDENNNILFDTGYIFHILDLKAKLVKSTVGAEPVVIKDVDLDISAAAISEEDSENVIEITATNDVIVDGVVESNTKIAFKKGTATPTYVSKETLESFLAGSFMKSIISNSTNPLADAVIIDESNSGVVVKVEDGVISSPAFSLTIKLKAGNTFEDGTSTKTIDNIKTIGVIATTPSGR